MKIFYVLIFLAGAFVLSCRAEGLDTLIEVGRSQTEIQKSYDGETKNYNAVKKLCDRGDIKIGKTSKKEIGSKCGEPVVVLKDQGVDGEKWIYKPAKSSFFEGEKIYLIFDENGVLVEVKNAEENTVKI